MTERVTTLTRRYGDSIVEIVLNVQFFYRAITAQGERVSGAHEARDQTAARKELGARFASVLEISPVDAKQRARQNKSFRVKQENVAVFFRRMATMLNSGVPLADALEFMSRGDADDTLAKAVDHLVGKVTSGNSLSSSMGDPRLRLLFDQVSIGMVALGEQTGQLSRVLAKLADLKERQLSLTRSLVSALTYPAVLLCVIVALGLLFTLILGPGEGGIFAAFGPVIPWPTRVVQSVAAVVRKPYVLVAIGLAIWSGVLLVRYQLRTNQIFRLRVHSLLLSAPLVGPLLKKIECAKILYVLSDGLEVGIPAMQALAMAKDVCGNDKVRVELQGVLRSFSDGSDLGESLAMYTLFPPMVLSMVEVGMESGQLDIILANACKSYEEEVQMSLDSVARLAEPILLMFAGLMAGFLALATLLPIINMVQTL